MILEDAVSAIPDEGWYSLSKVRAEARGLPCMVFAVGARGIGKTHYAMRLAYEMAVRGRQTMWLRRLKTETDSSTGFRGGFIRTLQEVTGTEPDRWEDKDDHISLDGRPAIYFASLSTYSNKRGNSWSDVDLVVFDEFIPEDRQSRRSYGTKDPTTALMSLLHTILRGRAGTMCLCLSNLVEAGNPFWARMEIYPRTDRDVTVWPDKGIAVELCRGYRQAMTGTSPWAKTFKAAHYADYDDPEADSLTDLVAKLPKGFERDPAVMVSGQHWYGCFMHDGL